MAIAIGIRATPKEIFFSIVSKEGSEIQVISNSRLLVPIAFNRPEQLKFIRTSFLDIIFQFKATTAGIRITEAVVEAETARVEYEAVIQEVFASSSVTSYITGGVNKISNRLGMLPANYKELVARQMSYPSVPGWNSFPLHFKESILVGLAALNN